MLVITRNVNQTFHIDTRWFIVVTKTEDHRIWLTVSDIHAAEDKQDTEVCLMAGSKFDEYHINDEVKIRLLRTLNSYGAQQTPSASIGIQAPKSMAIKRGDVHALHQTS